MISIQFGKIKRIRAPRLDVELYGEFETVTLAGCLVVTVGGQTDKMRTWSPGDVGDVVAVLFDDERPENSLVLGGVYGDNSELPNTSQGLGIDAESMSIRTNAGVSLRAGGAISAHADSNSELIAPQVSLGATTSGNTYAVRFDKMARELTKIQAQLEVIAVTYTSHTHLLAGEVIGTPLPPMTNAYVVDSVASNSVKID